MSTVTPLKQNVATRGVFHNPLNTRPDPFMTFYDGRYYLTTTGGDALYMWAAPSLAELSTATTVRVWTDPDRTRNQQFWAPTFYLLNGRWYLYYTADNGSDADHRLYVAESEGTDPLGPYHFKAHLAPPHEDLWAIDPALLIRGGRPYILWSGAPPKGSPEVFSSLYIAPMSDPWTISGPRTHLPAQGCPRTHNTREAPSILQHGHTTFLVYSTCNTAGPDYQLWMLTLSDGADPMVPTNWRQHPGAIFSRNDSAGVYGPGSNGFFTSPDGTEDWIVYHAKTTPDEPNVLGRTTRAQKFTWNADGTPKFGAPLGLGAAVPLPSGDPG